MADVIINAAGLRIVKLLAGKPPQSIDQLADALSVTRTAVTEQLNELLRAGFIESEKHSLRSRGRPRNLYKATDAALLLLFVQNQQLVVPAMWKAVEEHGGKELTNKILHSVSHSLAGHYLPRITAKKPEERLRQLMNLLKTEGGLADVSQKGGATVLSKRTCPFLSMADETCSICRVDQEMMSQVVGRPVRRTACRLDGAPCCTFEVAKEK
jgi:predicted ArsR family transcriptional regulator